ncbi:MAG TPA: nucleoside triphosphate pyrophosphohydrolase [Candidatus Limnocylindrales bacterium]|nr:nucleoside triphosphate pyrophosphohydrolase [Candidatus Limnocylindrales bacterium]
MEAPRPAPARGSPEAPDRKDFAAAAAELLDLVRHLTGPDGCPWDKEQNPRTLTPYLVEESHEIGEAVANRDPRAADEELGDLFYLAFFLAVALEKEGGATPAAVLRQNVAKMIGRHPHVFGGGAAGGGASGGGEVLDAQGVLRRWEERKRQESSESSTLGKRPEGLPALLQAYRIQEKAASVGFDWEHARGVVDKIREELAEVEHEMEGAASERIEEEIGDLLFAVVNLARFLRIDPEARLRIATEKFRGRFDRVAAMLREQGRSVEEAGLPELDRLWEAVKKEER